MLQPSVGAGVLDPTLTPMLNIGARSLGFGGAVAAVVLQSAVRLRIADGAAMAFRHLSVWHDYSPMMHVGIE